MKTPHLNSRRLALIALAALVSVVTPARAESEKITGPRTHENLAVYLIHGADRVNGKTYLTLQEALAQKKAIVRETGNVNQLVVENTSDDADIYIQAGDIVKGGKQDRALGTDLILESKSKTPISSFCVEQGRWTKRGKESAEQFAGSADQVASKELKLAVKHKKAQGEVWKSVAEAQTKLSSKLAAPVAAPQSASSLQLTLENDKVKASADSYIAALGKAIDGAPDAVGFAFAVNGKISSADVYGSRALFQKMWPKLLKAAAIEAVAELEKGKSFEPPTIEKIEAAIADAETGKASEEKLTPRVKAVTRESKANVLFETRDKDATVHRNYVVK
jgi:predicted DNA-binding WGR domain protein